MNILKIGGSTFAAIAVLGMAVPAQAQDRRWGGGRGDQRGDHGRRHHRGGDKIDAGDLVLGAVLLGGIIALTSGNKKKRQRAEAEYDAPYAPEADQYDGVYDTEAAGDRCARAAEDEGHNYAELSRTLSVDDTTWNGRSWVVKGKVEFASGDSGAARTARFRCALRAGSEPSVTFEGY